MMNEQEKPLLYFQTLGRRYKRLTPYPKPRPYDRAKDKGEFGNPVEMQAVFDSRRDYLITNPPYESHEEIGNDSRDLGLVLADFPGLHDFVFEMETIRRKSFDRLLILNQTRADLEALSHQLDAGNMEAGEVQERLRKALSNLEKMEKQVTHLHNELDAEAPRTAPKKRFSLLEIGAEMGIGESTVSTYIGQIRAEDANKGHDKQRIKTPKGGQLTREEIKVLKAFAAKKVKRPNRRRLKTDSIRFDNSVAATERAVKI